MNISGIVVHAKPQNTEAVRENLLALDGLEVHAIADDGRMVVTIERESDQAMADTVVHCQNLPGVLSAAMVYHHFDDIEEGDEVVLEENES